MKGTNYLNWFRRLLVLGAVVAAGVVTATAGATTEQPTSAGMAADGLRLQGEAQVYKQLEAYQAALGRKADGLRLQGEAQVYQQLQDIPDVVERYAAAHPYGKGLSDVQSVQSSSSNQGIVDRPPLVTDVQSVQSSSFNQGIVDRPPLATDATLAVGSESSTTSDGFNWSDWGIGMGAGFVLILCGCYIIGRQLKHRGVQTA